MRNFTNRRRTSDHGGISLSDLSVVGITGLAVAVLAGPVILSQARHSYEQTARQSARAIGIEVESFLQANSSLLTGPATVAWDSGRKQLVINIGQREERRDLNLPDGVSLPAGDSDPQANSITNKDRFCVVVSVGGQRAVQTQDGPAPTCQ